MKVRYLGDSSHFGCINGKVYNVEEISEHGEYRIIDEDPNDDNIFDDPNWKPGYLYPPDLFEIVEE